MTMTKTQVKTAIGALVLLGTMLIASYASAQGRGEAVQPNQAAATAVLSSTVSVARVLGMPEQIQAAVIEVARHLDTVEEEANAAATSESDEFVPADADQQSALESEALAAFERGEPAESDRQEQGLHARQRAQAERRRSEKQGEADLGSRSEPKTVQGVINRHQSEIVSCYQERLSSRPSLTGSVTVKFIVEKDGSVAAPVIEKSSLGDEQVESCITGTVESLTFPEPVSQQRTVWKFPFRFESR